MSISGKESKNVNIFQGDFFPIRFVFEDKIMEAMQNIISKELVN